MFGFELGREYKLSIAEIYSLYPEMEIVYFDEKILVADNIDEEKLFNIAPNMGGTIKIFKMTKQLSSGTGFRINKNIRKSFNDSEINSELQLSEIYNEIMSKFTHDRKNNYAINFYGNTRLNQKDYLLKAKKYFQKNEFSSRFVNSDFQNIKSYLVTKEKLLENKTDFNLIFIGDSIYIGYTVFVQDIDSYSKRDFGKTRDMIVGMLPPKLAQMMINFSRSNKKPPTPLSQGVIDSENQVIYDPFCGLGTVLLESIIAGNTEVYGSDISSEMIVATKKNIEYIKETFKNNLKKFEIVELDAKNIANSPILKSHKINSIVTEGYLGEIFGKNTIDLEKVKKQRQLLSQIYEEFFSGLKKISFGGRIVISFPFWEIKGKYNYFDEIPDIIHKYCFIDPFFPSDIELKPSRSGSLFYKRPDQTVGREIFKLRIKK